MRYFSCTFTNTGCILVVKNAQIEQSTRVSCAFTWMSQVESWCFSKKFKSERIYIFSANIGRMLNVSLFGSSWNFACRWVRRRQLNRISRIFTRCLRAVQRTATIFRHSWAPHSALELIERWRLATFMRVVRLWLPAWRYDAEDGAADDEKHGHQDAQWNTCYGSAIANVTCCVNSVVRMHVMHNEYIRLTTYWYIQDQRPKSTGHSRGTFDFRNRQDGSRHRKRSEQSCQANIYSRTFDRSWALAVRDIFKKNHD